MKGVSVNILGLAVATVLCAYSFSSSSPSEVVQATRTMVANASVGMSVGVEENPYNSLADQLEKKERELAEREANIVRLAEAQESVSPLAIYSFAMSMFLCFLVAVNFYLDWKRGHTINPFSLDLRKRS